MFKLQESVQYLGDGRCKEGYALHQTCLTFEMNGLQAVGNAKHQLLSLATNDGDQEMEHDDLKSYCGNRSEVERILSGRLCFF